MLPALTSNNTHRLHLDNNSNNRVQEHNEQHPARHLSRQQQQQQQQLYEAHQQQQQQQQQRSYKRNASMIFRIEHLLPSTSRTTPNAAIAPPPPTRTPPIDLIGSSSTHSPTNISPASSSNIAGSLKRSRLHTAPFNGVLLSQFIPKDTRSEAIPTYALMSSNISAIAEQSAAYCSTLSNGLLRMSSDLLRRIKLSEDIHSYNALFELQPGGLVHVRAVRDVGRDEELVAWFGEEMALLMSIPFLTPLNIQGNKRYTCHLCQLTFETPNPLKIHLALGCGRHPMDLLWIRLHYALKATSYTQQHRQLLEATATLSTTQPPPLTIQHSPTAAPSSTSSISPGSSPQPTTLPQRSPETQIEQRRRQQQQQQPLQQPEHQQHHSELFQQSQRFSAFKPVSPSIAFTAAMTTTSSFSIPNATHTSTVAVTTPPSTAFSYLTPIASVGGTLSHMHLLQAPLGGGGGAGGMGSNPLNAAAQIEAIVSNMGASKQGHLCIYCGKVYSRKYGLKIHIRTHTGFKPLKCKFCLRPFGDPSNLNKHVRLHLQSNAASNAQIEGYQCTLCNKTLARRRDLQRHIETRHSGDGGGGA